MGSELPPHPSRCRWPPSTMRQVRATSAQLGQRHHVAAHSPEQPPRRTADRLVMATSSKFLATSNTSRAPARNVSRSRRSQSQDAKMAWTPTAEDTGQPCQRRPGWGASATGHRARPGPDASTFSNNCAGSVLAANTHHTVPAATRIPKPRVHAPPKPAPPGTRSEPTIGSPGHWIAPITSAGDVALAAHQAIHDRAAPFRDHVDAQGHELLAAVESALGPTTRGPATAATQDDKLGVHPGRRSLPSRRPLGARPNSSRPNLMVSCGDGLHQRPADAGVEVTPGDDGVTYRLLDDRDCVRMRPARGWGVGCHRDPPDADQDGELLHYINSGAWSKSCWTGNRLRRG